MPEVTMLFSDRLKTQFMQHADVFEKFKVVMAPPTTATVVKGFGKSNVEAILKHCENGPYGVIAIFDSKKTYYRDPEIKVVSDGTNWTPLDSFLPEEKAKK